MVLGFDNCNMFGSMGGNPLSILGMGCGMGSNPFMSILGGGTYCNSIFGGGMFADKSGRPDYDAMAGFGVGSFILNVGTSLACQAIQGRGGSGSSKSTSGDIKDLEKKKQELQTKLNELNKEKSTKETTYNAAKKDYDDNEKIITNNTLTDEEELKLIKYERLKETDGENNNGDEIDEIILKKKKYDEAKGKQAGLKTAMDNAETKLEKVKADVKAVEEELKTVKSQIESAIQKLADEAKTKVKISDEEYNKLFRNDGNLEANTDVKTAKMALNKALATYAGAPDDNTKEAAKGQIKKLYEYLLHNDPDAITSKKEEACKLILKEN